MIEDNYRKNFIEKFSKRFGIDLENKMIDIYWYEIMEEKDKEIERLNNIINEAIYFLKRNACIDEDVEYFCDDLRYDDCKKLLEILKGVDKE